MHNSHICLQVHIHLHACTPAPPSVPFHLLAFLQMITIAYDEVTLRRLSLFQLYHANLAVLQVCLDEQLLVTGSACDVTCSGGCLCLTYTYNIGSAVMVILIPPFYVSLC